MPLVEAQMRPGEALAQRKFRLKSTSAEFLVERADRVTYAADLAQHLEF
jgi:hypothetical protein